MAQKYLNLHAAHEITENSEKMADEFIKQNFTGEVTVPSCHQLIDVSAEISFKAIYFANKKMGISRKEARRRIIEMIDLRLSTFQGGESKKQPTQQEIDNATQEPKTP